MENQILRKTPERACALSETPVRHSRREISSSWLDNWGPSSQGAAYVGITCVWVGREATGVNESSQDKSGFGKHSVVSFKEH